MTAKALEFEHGDLLLVVDVQKDFCPGGALPIEGGDKVVPVINSLVRKAQGAGIPVYASRDWHPRHHVSFEESGGPWPPHCLQDSDGARFHPELELPEDAVVVTKGTRFDQDQNSVFDQTGLAAWLHRLHIRRIFVAGLALDVCVLLSVLDGCGAGFEMTLIENATRPVTVEDGNNAVQRMRRAGASVVEV